MPNLGAEMMNDVFNALTVALFHSETSTENVSNENENEHNNESIENDVI